MVRIKEIQPKSFVAGVYYYNCVQCGLELTYPAGGNHIHYCHICKASQRLRTKDRRTDVPLVYLMGKSPFTRKIYHLRETNMV